jgi:hypothetical protein
MMETACASGVELLIEGHVAGCQRCQAFIASYQATPRILRDATDTPLPAGAETTLLEWIRKQRRE